MHIPRFTRRGILQGMGASAALLPFATLAGGGQGPGTPRRLIVMYSPNGVHPSWGASGSGVDMQLSESLSPLAGLRDQICVVEGVAFRSWGAPEHPDGTVACLTGRPSGNPQEMVGTGESIDQRIASTNIPPGGYGSMNLYAWPPCCETPRISFSEGGGGVALQADPQQAFADVFAGFMPPDPDDPVEEVPEDRRTFLRRKTVDVVNRDFNRVRGTLGAEDRTIIERHIEGLDALAQRIEGTNPLPPGSTGQCEPVPPSPTGDSLGEMDAAERGRTMAEVLAMAIACDRTRVGTLIMGPSSGGFNHHDISHSANFDEAIYYDQFYAQRFAELVQAFADVGALENTLIMWVNELGKFNMEGGLADHGIDDMPYVFAGGLAARGQSMRIEGSPNHNYLLAGVLQSFGVDADFFGDEAFTQAGQSAILSPFAA
ncbi:MAG: DUF1552 domain-containing protein [Nannocystaceae bacterium]|nr:DUF1552 domain-containing protein [Nannocystaceae bacterium]